MQYYYIDATFDHIVVKCFICMFVCTSVSGGNNCNVIMLTSGIHVLFFYSLSVLCFVHTNFALYVRTVENLSDRYRRNA